jgi:hypothetical protein
MENYYGRPKNDFPSGLAGEEIVLSRDISEILFSLEDSGLYRIGLTPPVVNRWSEAISKGIIPIGTTIREFEDHVRGQLNSGGK